MALQRSAGNAATAGVLRTRIATAPQQVAVSVQRDPPTPSNVAPPPATDSPQPPTSGWAGLKALADGSRKFRFGVGSHTLHRAQQGKDFSWSTQKPGPSADTRITLGVLPLPMPVGPVSVEMQAGLSAYAGGNAVVDVTAKDVIVEATAADLMKLGAAAVMLMTPGLQAVSLGMLAGLNLRGTATLVAAATAGVQAGARANLGVVANPALWPVAGYVDGTVGGYGAINAKAAFEAPVQVELSMGRLRLVAGQTFRTFATLTPEIGLDAGVAAGMIWGYRPASVKRQLWSHSVSAAARKQMKVGIEGGNWATLTAGDDGSPVIDMERIIVNGRAIVEELFRLRNLADDRPDPNPPGADPRTSAQGIGEIQTHGAKPPSNRNGAKILWTESEHIIPFATGKRLWEVIGLAVPGRGGHEDKGQTTIMIYYEAARFKTPVDNEVSPELAAKIRESDAVNKMSRARLLIDAGHPEQAKPLVRPVMGQMFAGLQAARQDAVNRTNAAIVRESNMHMDGSPLTNAERRGPEGQPEDAVPLPGRVSTAADQQYKNIIDLAREEVEAANLLR
jgi:hypothetical protein